MIPGLQPPPGVAAPAQEVLLTTPSKADPQVSEVKSLSLRSLRDMVLEGDPGCVCDPELFTGPPEEESPEEEAARVAVAREVCASCPVRLPCTAYGLRTRPAAGVWAGWTAGEVSWLAAAAARPARPRRRESLRPAGPVALGEVA
jgi:Transcription factor WhiB